MQDEVSTLEDRLRTRLRDLADQPTGPGPSGGPALLWRTGRRHHRRQRLGSVALVATACLLVLAVLGAAWVQARPTAVAPAGAPGTVGLPDRFYEPTPWLPGTGDDPPGRLVAIDTADRGGWTWTGSRLGVVGIALAGGAYRFLDLPDLAEADDATLSPDGRQVAYWTVGAPRGSPREDVTDDTSGTITGYAVYSTVTGDVQRHEVETEHGIATDTLIWVDSDHLAAGYGQVQGGPDDSEMSQSSSRDHATWVWGPADEATEPTRVAESEPWITVGSTGAGDLVVSAGLRRGQRGTRYDLVALDGTRREGPVTGELSLSPVFDRSGTRWAYVAGNGSPGPLKVGGTERPGDLLSGRVRGVSAVVGWIGTTRVVVEQVSDQQTRGTLVEVDVATGRTRDIALLGAPYGGLKLATDLLDAPVVDAVPPPEPWDPRVVLGEAVTIVLLAGVALWSWRRRRARLA